MLLFILICSENLVFFFLRLRISYSSISSVDYIFIDYIKLCIFLRYIKIVVGILKYYFSWSYILEV